MTTARIDPVTTTSIDEPALKQGAIWTFMALLLAHGMIDCLGGMWPIFKKLADLNLAWAGIISTVATTLTMAMQPMFGIWADTGGKRRHYILLGLLLTSAGMLLGPVGMHKQSLGLLPAYLMMFGLLLVTRLGQAMFHPPAAGLAGDAIAHKRSLLVSVFIGIGMLGFAFSQTLFSYTYKNWSGNTQWILLGCVPLFIIVWIWCKPLEQAKSHQSNMLHFREAFGVLKEHLLPLYGLLVLASGQMMGMFFLLPEMLQAKGYPDWIVNGGGFGFMVGGSVLLMVPAGHLADRIGRRRMLAITLVLAIAFYYLVILQPHVSVPVLAVTIMIAGGLLGTLNPLGVALGQNLLPGKASLASGLLMGFAWALGSQSMWMVGLIASRTTAQTALLYLGVFDVLGLVLCMFIRKPVSSAHA
jgi:FSR family fosmidomycin resistance protein-like MFS transporter